MLSDPITLTYNSVSKSLPRSSGRKSPMPKQVAYTVYGSQTEPDAVGLTTSQFLYADGSRRSEILLSKVTADIDSNTVQSGLFTNSVGLVFLTNPYQVGQSDIPLLRASLLSLVDSTLQGRLIAGEH
jgi:hypothetical protein